MKKLILDACCGGRMFWFNKKHPDAVYIDSRRINRQILWKKGKESRMYEVNPDICMDFRNMDFEDDTFSLVVFDPPHCLERKGVVGIIHKRYGSLYRNTWQSDLRLGFAECFRVLKPNGVLIFKWCECDIKLVDILALTPYAPLFGHKSGKTMKTHWVTFMKGAQNAR